MRKFRIVSVLKDGVHQYYEIEEWLKKYTIDSKYNFHSELSHIEGWYPYEPSPYRTRYFSDVKDAEVVIEGLLKPPPVYSRSVVKEF